MGRKVGAEGGHLKLELIQESHPYHHISAIAFNMALAAAKIAAAKNIHEREELV